jgi:predicted esterase
MVALQIEETALPPLRTIAALTLAACIAVPAPASAASTVRLPATACPGGDAIFADSYEIPPAIPHDPSNGSGGTWPGDVARSVNVPGVGTRNYYLHVPNTYAPGQALPLLVALHGAGGAGTAPAAAQAVRATWTGISDSAGFIVLAPVASGGSGGWVVGDVLGVDDDVEAMLAAIADTEAAYDVERSRVHLWGYSAGGHVAHAVALANTDVFSAYAVNAGVLRALACSTNYPGSPPCPTYLAGIPRKIPLDIHIGTGDSLYPEAQADHTRLLNAGWIDNRTLYFVPFSGGHVYNATHAGEIWNHLCPFALGP